MPITKLAVAALEPFADGREFGGAGPYLRIHGVATGELDPAAPQNAAIVDLDKAERNAGGMVEYELDLFILRPADIGRGSGTLVYDVTNRGRKVILGRLDEAPTGTNTGDANVNDPRTARDAGTGFTLGRGWTLVWSGWDWSAPRANNGMTARLPLALENGAPMVRRIRHEFQIGTRAPGSGDSATLTYPAVSTDPRRARLTVRDRESDARTEIPPDSWEFVDARTIRLRSPGTRFAPYKIYELWYEATGSRVIGVGFAAVRDLVSFLRYERADGAGVANPLIAAQRPEEGPAIAHALAFGVSQSGRFLRHFLELGMNDDSVDKGGGGRRVFDGVLTHVAGAGKTFANHSFAMPGRTATQHEDRLYPENWFPFGNAVATDPFSGRRGALLQGRPTDPLMIEVNTSTEYWQKGASLVHTDPHGETDAALPPGCRVYLIAGTQHGGGPGTDPSPGPCVNPRNPHSASPALRALIVALEAWVRDGVAPPDSRVPRLADGTLVDPGAVRMPAVPGFAVPAAANAIAAPADWVDPPARVEKLYSARVCAVDADGNEIAGIRLPPIAVPLGTYTGWNVYRAQPCELCDRDGSLIPFARTRAEREAQDDPRPSLDERYGSRAAYVAKVREAAAALVAARLLLPSDADLYIRAAEACERF